LGVAAGDALTMGNNNIDIGNLVEGGAGESDTIRIGRVGTQTATFIAGINGATVTGSAVMIDATTGQLGTVVSSERFKDEIKPMDKASDAILALKPVTFRYKKELDPKGVPQFGLVAEQVEKVNPDLVVREANGKVYSVRYDAVNAMLLNEFLKEHRKVEELEKDLRATIVQQQKEIEALTTGLQKVSAQLELNKPAPQTVLNNQ
jgi:Chaperone of endosialidase